MEEQSRILPSQEVLEQLFGLTRAAFEVDGFEDGDDVFEKKVGVACAAIAR